MDVTIIGAGVSGLTTGLVLQGRGVSTRIVTIEPPARTTSAVAGAIWYPYTIAERETGPRFGDWSRETLAHFEQEADEAEAPVRRIDLLELHAEPVADPWWMDMPGEFRKARPDELMGGRPMGWVFPTVVIDTPRYLAWLAGRYVDAGGSIETLDVPLFSTKGLGEVVVNCSGVGSRQIADDEEVYPIRGQVLRIANPGGIERCIIDEHNKDGLTYIFPRFDDVILGGSLGLDDWDRSVDDDLSGEILRRCAALEPRVADPQILEVKVGLRPGRYAIRVEAEVIEDATVVHNYGHAGNGWSVSWGCANDAADLAVAAL